MILNRIAPSRVDRDLLSDLFKARCAASDLFFEWGNSICSSEHSTSLELIRGYKYSGKISDYIDQVCQKQLVLKRIMLLGRALRIACDCAALVKAAEKKKALGSEAADCLVNQLDSVVEAIGSVISKSTLPLSQQQKKRGRKGKRGNRLDGIS